MKHYQKAAILSLVCLLSCTDVYAWGSKRPRTSTPAPAPVTPAPAPAPIPIPTPPSVPTTESSYVDQIKSIAAGSTCASYSWASRGRAPASYIKGMALNYARGYCRLKTTLAAPTALATLLSARAGDASKDALAHYSSTFSSFSMPVNLDGVEALRSLYTLGIGLGMRESSGKYCEGRDMSASNTSASTAEAGMFQTSYDSIGAHAELSKLYAEYKNTPERCLLDVYSAGISCGTTSNAGTGEGLTFQKLNKSCPAFAAEYAMVMLRVRRNHYGPINRKEAEVKTICSTMLENVESMIENDLNACDDLI